MARQKKTILKEAEQLWQDFRTSGDTSINWNPALAELKDMQWAYRNRRNSLSSIWFENSLDLMKNYLHISA